MTCHLSSKQPLTVEDLKSLQVEQTIYDSSHYSVWISRCPDCGQLYAICFDEEVDWEQGNDRCWNFFVPIGPEDIKILESDVTEISTFIQTRPFITWAPGGDIYWTQPSRGRSG